MVSTVLEKEQSQQETAVTAVVAGTAAHRILQKRKVFQVAKTKARQPELGSLAVRAHHRALHNTSKLPASPE
jgi:hypothetical protein